MRELFILVAHLLATLAKLMRPGGARAVVAESLLLKHQLLVLRRSRNRAVPEDAANEAAAIHPPGARALCHAGRSVPNEMAHSLGFAHLSAGLLAQELLDSCLGLRRALGNSRDQRFHEQAVILACLCDARQGMHQRKIFHLRLAR